MGVPKFYRWLSERYPLINQAIDESTLLPEVDNLYLDMNGMIHNATHGNEGITKRVELKDVMLSIVAAVDHAVKLTRPRKLLYMAVDGVAPRAKMNQQRSRRFRASRDAEAAKAEALARGEEVTEENTFDSNCITPGTEFMTEVSTCLRYFVRRKLKEDPAWQKIRIIFSGHEVEGEGEHKIVAFVRAAKSRQWWDPNTRHCMAGLDADLVMLALATHEPHFCLLREQVDFNAFRAPKFGTKTVTRETAEKRYQLLHIGLLREYLEIDMRPSGPLPFQYDGERVVDDFVLLTALVGNDFLPHLPSLDIGEGALDVLLRTYREQLPAWGGYLCDGGLIHVPRLEALLRVMGSMESEVFVLRAAEAAKFAKRAKRQARREAGGGGGGGGRRGSRRDDDDDDDDEEEAAAKAQTEAEADAAFQVALAQRLAAAGRKPAAITDMNDMEDNGGDHEERQEQFNMKKPVGVKERYYFDKFGVAVGYGLADDDAVLSELVQSYLEGLQWVMLYYYRGVPSWGWFYPFHYAPFTSDLVGLAGRSVAFRLGRPFKPYQQLLGCLPASSSKFLPASYKRLMTDPASPLAGNYPPVSQIVVDMNGKRNPWEGVTLIPFIKEADMLDAIARLAPDSTLSPDERQRNTFGSEIMYWHDPTAADTVASSLENFSDLTACQSRARVFSMPHLPVLALPSPVAAAAVREAQNAYIPDVSRSVGDTGRGSNDDSTPAFSIDYALTAAATRAHESHADQSAETVVSEETMAGTAALFSARPRPGCIVPAAGFPTLHTLPFSACLTPVSLNIFGMPSRKDTLILAVGEKARRRLADNNVASDDDDDADDAEKAFLSTAALANGIRVPVHEAAQAEAASMPVEDEELVVDEDAPDSRHVAPSAAHSGAHGHAVALPLPVVLPSAVHTAPHLLPAHIPSFSTTYAHGTTIADSSTIASSGGDDGCLPVGVAGAPVAEDFLTAWKRAKGAHANGSGSRVRSRISAQALAPSLLGRVVLVDWPHVREALVTSIADATEEVAWCDEAAASVGNGCAVEGNDMDVITHTPDAAVAWAQRAHVLETELLAGARRLAVAGIKIGRVEIIVTVQKLVGMRVNPTTGALSYIFGERGGPAELKTVPDLILSGGPPARDPRFVPHGPISPLERFPPGSRVVVLRGEARGCIATVVAHQNSTAVAPMATLTVEAELTQPEPPFGQSIARAIKDVYFDAKTAADIVGVSAAVLARVTGSVLVMPGKVDLGLNFKVRRALYLAGYVRCMAREAQAPAWASGVNVSRAVAAAAGDPFFAGSSGRDGPWEYAERALHLVKAYKQSFPAVFAVLASHSGEEHILQARLFGGSVEVERIATWLSQLDTAKRPLVPLATSALCPQAVVAIENAADAFLAALHKRGVLPRKTKVEGLGTADVFRPEALAYAVGSVGEGQGTALSATNVDGAAIVPQLGDRVANLSFGAAPLGLRATVVAVHAASGFVELVFDKEFVGGVTLGGLCSHGRGALVPWSAVLCLSRTPAEAVEAASSAGAGKPTNEVGESDDDTAGGQLAGAPRGRRGVVAYKAPQPQPQSKPQPQPQQVGGATTNSAGATAHGAGAPGGRIVVVKAPAASATAGTSSRTTPASVSTANSATAQGPAPPRAQPTRVAVDALFASAAATGASAGGRGGVDAPPAATPAPLDFAKVSALADEYFSDAHLLRDEYLTYHMRSAGADGWVAIDVFKGLTAMRELSGGNEAVIATSIAHFSKALVVSPDKKRVRRVVRWVDPASIGTFVPPGGTGSTAAPANTASSDAPAVVALPPVVAALFARAADVRTSGQSSSVGGSFGTAMPQNATSFEANSAAAAVHAQPQSSQLEYWRSMLAQTPSSKASAGGTASPSAVAETPTAISSTASASQYTASDAPVSAATAASAHGTPVAPAEASKHSAAGRQHFESLLSALKRR